MLRRRAASESRERVRAIVRAFAPDVRKQRGKLLGGMAFGLVYAIARVIEPWPLKVVFDQVLFHKPAQGRWNGPFLIFGSSAYDILAAAAVVLVVAGIVRGVSYYYEDFLLSTAAQEIVYRIRARLYRHLHRLPVAFHQRRRTGDTLVRLSSDIVVLRDMLVDSVVNVGTGVVMIGLMLAVMFLVDPVLTALSLASMPLVAILSALYGRRIRSTSRKQRKREGQVASLMHEALGAVAVVQLYGAEEREQERFHAVNRGSLKQGIKATRLEARMNRGVELALAGATVVVLWAGTLRALHGAMTPGDLIVFISYLRAAYRPLRRTSKTVQRSAKAFAAAERVVELLQTEPELTDAPDATPAPRFAGRIGFDDVGFAYEPVKPVLHGITAVIEPGSTVAIVGHTGSGKSTLVNLVPRLFDPTTGRVTIDGHDIRGFTLESVREQISLVQQETVLFGLSIAENIRYGCPDATDEQVEQATEAAGLMDLVDELPDGFDTVLTERGTSLSGGQRQRVAIARALVRETPILLLDEPTTGLDPAARHGVIDALLGLMNDSTTLVVTHDMELAQRADTIIVLEHGRLIAQGTYEQLSAQSAEFRSLAGLAREARPQKRTGSSGEASRVLFYSHNGVGVGHLQRQLDLATAYRKRHPDSVVLLASGSHGASMFRIPSGIDYVKLPSLQMVDRYRTWTPRELPLPLRDVVDLRTELLEKTVRTVAPDLLVADFMPAGPYGELLPALAELERVGGRAVAGFRDIVDEPSFVRQLWAETGVYDVLERHYSSICVYGDPRTIDFVAAYGLDGALASRVRYCGYLGRPSLPANGEASGLERPLVVATSGGGVDGPALIEAFVDAASRLQPRRGGTWLAVTGPLMSDVDHERIVSRAAGGVDVRRVVPELRNTVGAADCVVSMAGYNTVCDIMSFRRRSVLVPRAQPSREQSLRAERLKAWGVADVIPAEELAGVSLANAVENALDQPSQPAGPLPLDGVGNALKVFDAVRSGDTDGPAELDGWQLARDSSLDQALSPELALVDPERR